MATITANGDSALFNLIDPAGHKRCVITRKGRVLVKDTRYSRTYGLRGTLKAGVTGEEYKDKLVAKGWVCDQDRREARRQAKAQEQAEAPTYGSLREKIAAEKAEREANQTRYLAAFTEAWEQGRIAAQAITPQPMTVLDYEDNGVKSLLGLDPGPVKRAYHVAEGVCGFAWLTLRVDKKAAREAQSDARKFINWLTGNAKPVRPDLAPTVRTHKGYYGGTECWISEHGQSHARKVAHARAAATVLANRFPGLMASAGERLD